MKKNLVALLVAALMLLSVVPAMAEISPILPYEGEAIEYHCVGADLITEKPETQVYQEYLKLLGDVTLNWELIPVSDIFTKNNLYLNSGEIPDLMWTYGNTSVIQTYGDMNYWLDLSPYVDEYMPNYKWWFENKPHMQELIGEEGEIYCTVDVDPYDYVCQTFFYNKTALDSLGYTEPPKTWDEMLEMMRAFKKANPEATPFALDSGDTGSFIVIFSYLSDWENAVWYFNTDTGLWDNAIVNPESGYKEIIEILSLMYSEGLIHPEFDAIGADQAKQIISDGNWLFTFQYAGNFMGSKFGEEAGIDNSKAPIEVGTFTTPALTEGAQRYGMISISANALPLWGYFAGVNVEKPELMAAVMDLAISDELTNLGTWGIQGVSYEVDENGDLYYLDDYATNLQKQEELGMSKWFNHLGRMIHNSTWYSDFAKYTSKADKDAIDLLCDELREGILMHKLPVRGEPTFTTEEGDTISLSKTPMGTFANENIVLFITGERPMEEWDAFVEEYKAMGNLEEVLSIYNSAKQNERDTSTSIPDYPW